MRRLVNDPGFPMPIRCKRAGDTYFPKTCLMEQQENRVHKRLSKDKIHELESARFVWL
jgi:hypothetical protein